MTLRTPTRLHAMKMFGRRAKHIADQTWHQNMTSLLQDCRGALDLRLMLILMLMGGGVGGFTLFSQSQNSSTPSSTTASVDKQNTAQEAENDPEAAIEQADTQAESMIEEAENHAETEIGNNPNMRLPFNTASAEFRSAVEEAQAEMKEKINSIGKNLAQGVSPRETIREATEEFKASLKEAKDQYQQSLRQMQPGSTTNLFNRFLGNEEEAAQAPEPAPPRPFFFNVVCKIANTLYKIVDPLAQVCKDSPATIAGNTPSSGGDVSGNNGQLSENSENSENTASSNTETSNNNEDDANEDSQGEDTQPSNSNPAETEDNVVSSNNNESEDETSNEENSQDSGTSPFVIGNPSSETETQGNQDSGDSVTREEGNIGLNITARPDTVTTQSLLLRTGANPRRGLYRSNRDTLDIDGWEVSCDDNHPIFVSGDISGQGGAVYDNYVISDYSGGSINQGETESRDLATYPRTVYLNQRQFGGLNTSEKMMNISKACYEAKASGAVTNKQASCHALRDGLKAGWLNDEVSNRLCYNTGPSRECKVFSGACDE